MRLLLPLTLVLLMLVGWIRYTTPIPTAPLDELEHYEGQRVWLEGTLLQMPQGWIVTDGHHAVELLAPTLELEEGAARVLADLYRPGPALVARAIGWAPT